MSGCCWCFKMEPFIKVFWFVFLEIFVMFLELISIIGIISLVIRLFFIILVFLGYLMGVIMLCPCISLFLLINCNTENSFCFYDGTSMKRDCIPIFTQILHKPIFGNCHSLFSHIYECDEGIFGCVIGFFCFFWSCEREIAGLCCAKLLKAFGKYENQTEKFLLWDDYEV